MSKSDEWSTPPELIQVLDAEFNFNLELCAAEDNRALPIDIPYWGLDNQRDVLTTHWTGTAYMNPPYSMLPLFIARAAFVMQDKAKEGYYYPTVMLIPAYTDTKIWHDIINTHAAEVRFLKGRLAFLLQGQKQSTARFPSAIVIFNGVKGMNCSYKLWDWRANQT